MSDVLISAAQLAAAVVPFDAATLLDVRWTLGGPSGHADYVAGHIPGAVFVDLDHDLAAPPGAGGRHPLPNADAFGAAMRGAGVSADRPVVVYAAATPPGPAARAWWLLRYFGHPDVRVLDGGIDAWVAAGGPLATGPARTPTVPVDFAPRPGGMPLLDATAAASLAKRGVLIDVRTEERFRGESEPIDRVAGHIPGARNVPIGATVSVDGRLLAPDALRAAVPGDAGENDAPSIGAYCGSGVAAAQLVLGLAHAGRTAALYLGSWSDWITDPERPVAHGA